MQIRREGLPVGRVGRDSASFRAVRDGGVTAPQPSVHPAHDAGAPAFGRFAPGSGANISSDARKE
jgi:hypothetical protein